MTPLNRFTSRMATISLAWAGFEADAGDVLAAAAKLDAAAELARTFNLVGVEIQALARRACLAGGDHALALASLAAHSARAELLDRMRANYWIWCATGRDANLEEAQRLLAHLEEHAPAADSGSMVARVPLYRAIHEAERLTSRTPPAHP